MPSFKPASFNLGDYLQIIFRRKWLFIIPCVLTFTIATIGSFFLPEIYQAKSLLLMERGELLQPLVQGMAVPARMEQEIQTLTEQILSFNRIEEMVKELKLDARIKKGDTFNLEMMIKGLRKRIIVQPIRGSDNLIEIIFEDANNVTCQKVVNFITQSFVHETVMSKEEEANAAINFIRQQLDIYKKKLEDSEAALRAFKEQNILEMPGFNPAATSLGISPQGLTEGGVAGQLNQSVSTNVRRLVGFQDSLVELRLELESQKKKRDLIKKQLSGQEKISHIQTKTVNPLVDKLSARIGEMQIQLAELYSKKYTDKHPLVITLKKQIERAKEQLKVELKADLTVEKTDLNPVYQDLEKQLRDIEANIDTLEAKEAKLTEMSSRYSHLTLDVPAKEQELTKLTRDTNVNQSIYAMLLQKLETANISQRLETSQKGTRFRVVNAARLPIEPIKPNKRVIAMLGLIIGSMLGFGAVFLGEYTDHSFRSLEDAEAFLEIPSLGSISKIITEFELTEAQRKFKARAILFGFCLALAVLIAYIMIVFLKG